MNLFLCFVEIILTLRAVEGLLCYECPSVYHYDCTHPNYMRNCTPLVHDTCQTTVIIFPKGRRFEKRCATLSACSIVSAHWSYYGLCDGVLGSQCAECCSGDLCNGGDPTYRLANAASSMPSKQAAVACWLICLWFFVS